MKNLKAYNEDGFDVCQFFALASPHRWHCVRQWFPWAEEDEASRARDLAGFPAQDENVFCSGSAASSPDAELMEKERTAGVGNSERQISEFCGRGFLESIGLTLEKVRKQMPELREDQIVEKARKAVEQENVRKMELNLLIRRRASENNPLTVSEIMEIAILFRKGQRLAGALTEEERKLKYAIRAERSRLTRQKKIDEAKEERERMQREEEAYEEMLEHKQQMEVARSVSDWEKKRPWKDHHAEAAQKADAAVQALLDKVNTETLNVETSANENQNETQI